MILLALSDPAAAAKGVHFWIVKWSLLIGLLAWIVALLRRPLRERYEAAFVLDLLESAVREGRSVERVLLDVAGTGVSAPGARFHELCSWLRSGETLAGALRRSPHALPEPIQRMLIIGLERDLVPQVLPVCRRRLAEYDSRWRAASTIVAGSGTGAAFFAVPIVAILGIFVYPKFRQIAEDMAEGSPDIAPLFFSFNPEMFQPAFYGIAALVLVNLWLFTGIFPTRGFAPRIEWVIERFEFVKTWLPWRRLRARADLTSLIAEFLDTGMPEDLALACAGDAVGTRSARRRIETARARLRQGNPLADALEAIDDGGGFRWRIRNVVAGGSGFADALALWHRALEAKANFKEQAAVQIYTAFLISLTGLIIGTFAAGILQLLIGLMELAGPPW